jgi:hypothetical protein
MIWVTAYFCIAAFTWFLPAWQFGSTVSWEDAFKHVVENDTKPPDPVDMPLIEAVSRLICALLWPWGLVLSAYNLIIALFD